VVSPQRFRCQSITGRSVKEPVTALALGDALGALGLGAVAIG
jgi:hypothetical protein